MTEEDLWKGKFLLNYAARNLALAGEYLNEAPPNGPLTHQEYQSIRKMRREIEHIIEKIENHTESENRQEGVR